MQKITSADAINRSLEARIDKALRFIRRKNSRDQML